MGPEHFNFQTTVSDDGTGTGGGWRAACLHIRFGYVNTASSMICKLEVGMPLRANGEAEISLAYAKRISAEMANEAAYSVLSRERRLGVACTEFISLYRELMAAAVPGARVQQSCPSGLTPVIFGAGVE